MKRILMAALFCAVSLFSACGQAPAPQPNELQTPQYALKLAPETDFEEIPKEEIHGGDGVKVIGDTDASPQPALSAVVGISPDDIWQQDETVTYNAFTLPEKAALDESGCIGVLAIPKIGLTVNVYEAEDEMEAMDKGAAHFRSTSAWDGNVGLSAHNVNLNGTDGYFKNLYTLKVGDTLSYETALGGRVYEVTKVKTISADDWSELSRSTENRVTLITCISGQPEKRLMVQAAEK